MAAAGGLGTLPLFEFSPVPTLSIADRIKRRGEVELLLCAVAEKPEEKNS